MGGQNELILGKEGLHTGTVKFFMNDKGYGFVVSDQPIKGMPKKKDIFIHHRNGFNRAYQRDSRIVFIRNGFIEVKDGDKVVFKAKRGEKGPIAEVWATFKDGDVSL